MNEGVVNHNYGTVTEDSQDSEMGSFRAPNPSGDLSTNRSNFSHYSSKKRKGSLLNL
jgi:hypothetical protein